MNRRNLLTTLAIVLTLATLAGPGTAAAYADNVEAQLTRQGFVNIASETTWLGRVRITADRGGGHREIVLNPRTGEILRDIWTPDGSQSGQVPIVDNVGGGGSGGGSAGGSGGGSSGASGGASGGGSVGGSGGGSGGGSSSGSSSGSGSSSDDGGGSGSDSGGGSSPKSSGGGKDK